MTTENLGRVQGGSVFYSTTTSSTSVSPSTLTPTNINPLIGDCILFSNGDLRKITSISSSSITCGSVLASLKGPQGASGTSTLYDTTGQNTDGPMTQKAVTAYFNNTTLIKNSNGGFAGGRGASTRNGGGAVGSGTGAGAGFAGGLGASTIDGGAVGDDASSTTGGAVGYAAIATSGFAGGDSAIATADGAVQLGQGTNSTDNTLQFRNYRLLNASGLIPKERISLTASDVGALSDTTVVPTKVSQLTNDTGYISWQTQHPVGTIYISTIYNNPANLFGGDWVRLETGRVLWSASEGTTGGSLVAAGLPDIQGTFGATRAADYDTPTGAFTQQSSLIKSASGSGTYGRKFTFKASSYNSSIYGKSTTVQPPAINVFMWERVA